ncbi:MAG: hypothetical protein JWR55_5 [Aeromicrobium sp.]|nr:hypothetical protein [Aeromicrobium sp.]
MTVSPSSSRTRQSTTPRLFAARVVALCLLLGSLAFAPAHAADGSLSGTVLETGTSEPIQDAIVEVISLNSTVVAATETDEVGTFSLPSLSPGSYRVHVSDAEGNHVAEYYDEAPDLSTSATVTVTEDGDTPLGTIRLDVGARIAGTVRGEDGTPIDRASVDALGTVNGTEVRYGAETDENGSYTVQGLPGGAYRIEFRANDIAYFDEFYQDRATAGAADPVTIAAGSKTDLGMTGLAAAVPVRGLVTDAAGAPLGGIGVEANRNSNGVVVAQSSGSAVTTSEGVFSLRLPPGSYRLAIGDGSSEFQNLDGDTITIEAGETPDSGVFTQIPAAPAPSTPPVVAKRSASVKVSAKNARKKATLTITVRASGVTPTGKVTIRLGSRTLKTVTLRNGRAKVTLNKQKKGKRTYKINYSGDSRVRAKTVSTSKVKIK